MHRRRSLTIALTALLSANVLAFAASPALATQSITYTGRGVALTGTVAGNSVGLADTLPLLSSGGVQNAEVLTAGVPNVLGADTLHAATVGQGDRTRSDASIAAVSITVGSDTVTLDYAMSRTMAVSTNGAPTLSGSTEVDGLVVNGSPITPTGAANQTVTLPDGQLVINEQTSSTSGSTGSITVNALHLIVPAQTDLTVASSSAGVTSGSSSCSSGTSPTTGGGWIPAPTGGKGTFGLTGKNTTGGDKGHVLYVDHNLGTKIEGVVDTYQQFQNTATLQGPAVVNGQPNGRFSVNVQDNGQGGTTDSFSVTVTATDNSTVYAASNLLSGGNIQIHKMCK
jgi:hypothetical protein